MEFNDDLDLEEVGANNKINKKIKKIRGERDRLQGEIAVLNDDLARQRIKGRLNDRKYKRAISERNGAITVNELNERLGGATGPNMRAQRAFANVSNDDRNLLVYANKRARKESRAADDKARAARAYELRAFNRDAVQIQIALKLRELENIPHMTIEERSRFLERGRSRKIYKASDIPETLRGEERVNWLESKNKRAKLYERGDSAYDNFVEKQKQLNRQFSDGNKYKTNYKYLYSYTY